MRGDLAGDVQEAVAQGLRFGGGERVVEQQCLCPGDQIERHEHELEPDLVVGEGVKRQVAHPAVLGRAHTVLGVPARAVVTLKLSRVACAVGQDELETVPVSVCESELRARVGALLADDQARALRPASGDRRRR